MSEVIALFCADLHLSYMAPVARSTEKSWLEAQVRPLRQLKELQEKYGCPVVCAGDVFDKYNPSPALINWAIEHLPIIYAISGQHDLPLHSLEDIKKSSYWTLVEAKKLEDLQWGLNFEFDNFDVSSFPWGEQVKSRSRSCGGYGDCPVHVAIAHSYVWTAGNEYVGAPNDNHLFGYAERLKGYDVAVFGDNHRQFQVRYNDCEVYNCGCLIRRKRDEREYKPAVGLLYDDGKVGCHYLDVSEDKWLEDDDELPLTEMDERSLAEFLDGLGGLDVERVGFSNMVRRYVTDGRVSEGVGKVMLEALEGTKHGDH